MISREQAEHFAAGDREIEPLHRHEVAERLAQRVSAYNGRLPALRQRDGHRLSEWHEATAR